MEILWSWQFISGMMDLSIAFWTWGGNLEFATMVFKLPVPQDAGEPGSGLTALSKRGSSPNHHNLPFILFIPEHARVPLNNSFS